MCAYRVMNFVGCAPSPVILLIDNDDAADKISETLNVIKVCHQDATKAVIQTDI